MYAADVQELARLVADLTAVADGLTHQRDALPGAPPASGGVNVAPVVAGALSDFERAWCPTGPDGAPRIAEFASRVAAAGMAYLEGDVRTAAALVSREGSPARRPS